MRIALIYCDLDTIFEKYPLGALTQHEARPPLGLGSLAAQLLPLGHDVKIYDQSLLGISTKSLVDQVSAFDPRVVGFSILSVNLGNTIRCLKGIKEKLPHCFAIAGGIHATLRPYQTLESGKFDAVIAGEGEQVIVNVVNQLENDGKIRHLTPGLWVDGMSGNGGTAVLSSIDDLFYPDREVMRIQEYENYGALIPASPCHSLFQSRGCPFTCAFCSKPAYHKLYRIKSVKYTIAEIEYLVERFSAVSLVFREDNFTANKRHLRDLCRAFIDRFKGEIPWECESRSNLSYETLEMMRKAGCRGIWSGVETIVPRWQRWLRKFIPAETTKTFYKNCSSLGIDTGALFLFGFPSQTKEEIQRDMDFAMSLPVRWRYFQSLVLFPGSALEDFYKQSHLYHSITSHVSLALIDGLSVEDMVNLEKCINEEIKVG